MSDEEKKTDKDSDAASGWTLFFVGMGVTVAGGLLLDYLRRGRDRQQGIVGYAPIRSMPPSDATGWEFAGESE